MFAGLSKLRKLCNHPDLFMYTSENVLEEEGSDSGGVSNWPSHKRSRPSLDLWNENSYGHWMKSGKMVVVEALLKLWKSQGHKVLIFSQSRQVGITYCMLVTCVGDICYVSTSLVADAQYN